MGAGYTALQMTALPSETVARFDQTPESVGAARQFVRNQLEHCTVSDPPLEATVLLTSELVTNALLHARTAMSVRVVTAPDRIRVEVEDGNSRVPRVEDPPLDATSGRGMHLVEAMAAAWGSRGTPQGKVVWFELPLSS